LDKDGVFTRFADRFGLPPRFLATVTNVAQKTTTPGFQVIGSSYNGFGALANLLQAEDDLKNGDRLGAGLDAAAFIGNAIDAAKPLVPLFFEDGADGLAAAELVGSIGSGIGVAAAAIDVIYLGIKSADETLAYQHDSSEFLQRGLGLNPAVADALSAPANQSNGSTASAVLLCVGVWYDSRTALAKT
jgi:hypothetical protein